MTTTLTAPSALRAYHGDPAIKEKYLDRVRLHRAQDEIINGQYWDEGKGCAVGCTIHSGQHRRYETELGVPVTLAYAEDSVFERLYRIDPVLAKEWPLRFLNAIPVGADLSLVWPRWILFILADEKFGCHRHLRSPERIEVMRRVVVLFERWVSTGVKPESTEFSAARCGLPRYYWRYYYAADADAAAAADAADADAAAADAAADAAAADAAAAAAAADAAAAGRRYVFGGPAWERARGVSYVRFSDKLIELLAAAPVIEV